MSYEYNNPLYPYAHYPPYPPYQYRLPDDDPFLQAQAAHNLDSFSQWYPFDLPNNFNPTTSPPPPPVPVPTPPTITNPGVTGPPMHHMLSLAGSLDTHTGIFYRTPEHPRLRTAQACEKCRTRKAKCSGEHPSCKRCILRNLTCEYAKEGRVRGPNKPKLKIPAPSPSSPGSKSNSPISPTTNKALVASSASVSVSSCSSSNSSGHAGKSSVGSASSSSSVVPANGNGVHVGNGSHNGNRSTRPRPPNLRLENHYSFQDAGFASNHAHAASQNHHHQGNALMALYNQHQQMYSSYGQGRDEGSEESGSCSAGSNPPSANAYTVSYPRPHPHTNTHSRTHPHRTRTLTGGGQPSTSTSDNFPTHTPGPGPGTGIPTGGAHNGGSGTWAGIDPTGVNLEQRQHQQHLDLDSMHALSVDGNTFGLGI